MFTSAFWQLFYAEQAHTFGCGRVQTSFLVHDNLSSEKTHSVVMPSRGRTESIQSVNFQVFSVYHLCG